MSNTIRRTWFTACLVPAVVIACLAVAATAPTSRPATGPTSQPTSAAASQPASAPLRPTIGPWRAIFRGVEYAQASATTPRPMQLHALRVDLTEPNVRLFVTPSNGEAPLDTGGMMTSTFLVKYGCQAAVNASPYQPVKQAEGTDMDVQGLSASNGDVYSPPSPNYGAMTIGRDNKVRIVSPPFDANGVYNGVGGFRVLLRGGQTMVPAGGKLHPRTAAGVSKDGRYLYLIALDGRQDGYSEGASEAETAEWLLRFGAHDGLNLDGGGSTAMVISDGKGGAKVLNRPIHDGVPGRERVNANHLGVFADPLPRK